MNERDRLETVLPRMREWIEITELIESKSSVYGSPSYEGVD